MVLIGDAGTVVGSSEDSHESPAKGGVAVHLMSARKRGLRGKGVVGNITQLEHIRLCFKWDGGLTTRVAAGRKPRSKETDHGADGE